MRRDRLNKLIEEIRALVPIICNKTKKSETTRSNILRLTANFLRVQRLFPSDESNNEDEDCGTSSSTGALVPVSNGDKVDPPFLWDGLPHLESMEGFFFLLAEDGRVLFISENVDKFIGYSQIDMMGHPIYNFCHPADLTKLQATLNTGNRMVKEEEEEEEEKRQSFYVRLKEKPLAKNDSAQYEHLHVVGRRRRVARHNKGGLLCNFTFVGVMRPVRDRPITELSLVESVQDQYITRHLPDGRIIYADHRIATIAGYLPGEVKGKSAFNFFNAEDLPWTTMAMRHMFASSSGEGSTVYRLLTQTGQYICLQTKGYLEFNRTTNKIETFICINTVVKPEDEEKYLNEQKERFSPFITELEVNAMKQPKLTYSPSPIASNSCLSSSPSRAVLASSPTRGAAATAVSVIASSPPRIVYSPTSPAAKSPNYLRPPSPYQQAKRSLSPQPLGNNKRLALSPPQSSSVIKGEYNGAVQQAGGSKRHHNGLVVNNGVQYVRRVDPQHRVEGGHRVVDIDQDVFPALSVPSGGPGRETAMSHLDFTGVIEEHNEVHHRQRLMELPTLDCLQLDLDLDIGNNVQQPHPAAQQQVNALQQQANVPQQRVNSVIRALPVPQQQQQHHPAAPPQRHPDDRTKGDLIAEKLKLLASDRSEEASTLKKDQEVDEQDLLSLLGEQQLLLPPQAVDNLSNYMSWEVKEEEVSHS